MVKALIPDSQRLVARRKNADHLTVTNENVSAFVSQQVRQYAPVSFQLSFQRHGTLHADGRLARLCRLASDRTTFTAAFACLCISMPSSCGQGHAALFSFH